MRVLVGVLRALAALAIVAAIVAQLIRSLTFQTDVPGWDGAFIVTNFFSFFTIDSNVLSAVALAVGAVLLLARRGDDPRWFTVLRACATTYMAITGIVYNVLLRGIELPQGQTVGWSNEILHVVAPILVVLDWLLSPGRVRLGWSRLAVILAFPLVWTAYTLIRGPLAIDGRTGIPFYPYPFLNPAGYGGQGYGGVAFWVAVITVAFVAVGAGVIAISRRARRAGAE